MPVVPQEGTGVPGATLRFDRELGIRRTPMHEDMAAGPSPQEAQNFVDYMNRVIADRRGRP